MTNSNIIEKIQKVLALASNNPSAEEGQTAMLLAQKMMAENNISMSDVSVTEIKTKEVVDQVVDSSRRMSWWQNHLGGIIADNFKCGIYINKNRREGTTNIKFVGLKNDVELAKQIYLYAVEVISHNYKEYVRKNSDRMFTKGIKNQYILGFLEGLKEKFSEQIKNNTWGLVLVKDQLVDKALKDLNLRKAGKTTININGNELDRYNGYRDGKSFNLISGKLT